MVLHCSILDDVCLCHDPAALHMISESQLLAGGLAGAAQDGVSTLGDRCATGAGAAAGEVGRPARWALGQIIRGSFPWKSMLRAMPASALGFVAFEFGKGTV